MILKLPLIMGSSRDFEPGSYEWLAIKARLLWDTWNQERRDVKMLRDYLDDLVQHKAWRYLPDPKKPINNPGEFLKRLIGLPAKTVVEIIAAGDPKIEAELKLFLAEETAGLVKPGGANNPAGSNQHRKAPKEVNHANGVIEQKPPNQGSNNADYLLRRVARLAKGEPLRQRDPATGKLIKITSPDRQQRAQEALEQYQISAITAHEAATWAGIVKPTDPLNQLRRWWRAATPDQRAAFKSEMDDLD